MKSPEFWNRQDSTLVKMLRPFSRVYGDIAQSRINDEPTYISKLPVICVGNVTMGGSGKTPVVQSIVQMLKEAGKQPAVLMRGYGGSNKNTMAVDIALHNAALVGDEALLHAGIAPTVVSADRVKGAQMIEGDAWHTHIVMDDGLQNPALKKTLSLMVIDGDNPFGNGEIFPAGPLRENVDEAMRRVQAIIMLGKRNADVATRYGFIAPLFTARLVPANTQDFNGKPVLAFAGIGNPQKFFDTLQQAGAQLVGEDVFPDHYTYKPRDIKHLQDKAARAGALLVTTRKDWVRLDSIYRDNIHVLDVSLEWDERAAVTEFFRAKGML